MIPPATSVAVVAGTIPSRTPDPLRLRSQMIVSRRDGRTCSGHLRVRHAIPLLVASVLGIAAGSLGFRTRSSLAHRLFLGGLDALPLRLPLRIDLALALRGGPFEGLDLLELPLEHDGGKAVAEGTGIDLAHRRCQ